MKRLIFLQLHYETGPKAREKAFKQFRDDMKQFPFIKIITECEPRPEVVIDFPDDRYDDMYNGLRKLDIVEVIDFSLPVEKTEEKPEKQKKKFDVSKFLK